jgi:hypothetical protein
MDINTIKPSSLNPPTNELAPSAELERLGIRPLWGKENLQEPAYSNKREKYEHRLMAYLKASGLSNIEIAERMGYSPVTVNYVVRQPFMEEMILLEMRQATDPAMRLLANESLEAALRLVDISKNAQNDETRRKANNDILDRKYGKPNQPMSVSSKSPAQMSDEELVKIIENAEAKKN